MNKQAIKSLDQILLIYLINNSLTVINAQGRNPDKRISYGKYKKRMPF